MGSIACQVAQIVGQYRLDGAEVRLLRCEGEHVLVPDLAMQRVMTNLIDNALTHGSGQVEVDLWRQEGEVFVVVYDQGRGISTYDMERAVQPFLRLNDITGAAGHCGLGLAIVVQIAQQLCGRLVHLPFDGRRSGIGIAFPAQT
jgi:two-component system osmolarity sensor histidine kinase EnvZ